MVDAYSDRDPGYSHDPSTELDIRGFCDMDQFEKMMKDWASATGLATVAVGRDGEYISGCYNFTEFCHKLTRKSPEGLRRCVECDKHGAGIYLCHAGLVDFAAPIVLEDGTLLGNIVGGQVLPESPDEARFRETARELSIDEDAYIKALRKVNVRNRREIEASFDLLASAINMFVRTSYAARKSAASLSERASIISSLSKIYFCDYYIDLAADSYMELDATDELHAYTSGRTSASELFIDACKLFVEQDFINGFCEFTDLETLKYRLRGRQSITYEFIRKGSGWRRATFIAVDSDEDGLAAHVIFALQHIQEEKERELEVQRALKASADEANRANRAKSEFLSRMSHDIRTPLNGIIGMTYLTDAMDLPEAAHENLKKVDTSSKFLLSLINDVLDMSKAESERLELHCEPYPSAEFFRYLDAVIRPLCEEKNQQLVIDANTPDGVDPLMDELRINQIYFNLFSNAVKYTPEGGTIYFRLRCGFTDDDQIAIHAEISDTGIGMSKEFMKTLFEPFTQENRIDNSEMRGTGLGLAIVKQLIDRMGGTIRVESEVGIGSTFFFDIPFEYVCLSEATSGSGGSGAPVNASALSGMHVLLCEDHPLNQEIARALLEGKGMVVEITDDGKMGVDAFEKSSIGYYDCILMDIRMPVMDGYGATKSIRALDRADAKSVPIVAMTADAFSDDVKKCIEVGMDGHIAKPIEPEVLFDSMAEILHRRAGE